MPKLDKCKIACFLYWRLQNELTELITNCQTCVKMKIASVEVIIQREHPDTDKSQWTNVVLYQKAYKC